MARGSNLITSEYGKIISGAKRDYFEKLKALVKSSENDKLWAAVKGGQADTWSAPIKAYTDKGGPAIGFGSHFIPEGRFAKVNGAIKFGKATVDISWEITNSTSGKHQGTALVQVSMICDRILINFATGLYEKIQKYHPTWLTTLVDHEFCAMLDMAYNMGAGTAWVTDKDKFGKLIAAIDAHQTSVAQKLDEKKQNELQFNVVKTFLLYCNPNSAYKEGLIKRRKKDGELYTGNTAFAYDADVPGTYDSIVAAYKVDTASFVTVELNTDSQARITEALDARGKMSGTKLGAQIDEALMKGATEALSKLMVEVRAKGINAQTNIKTQSAKKTGVSDTQVTTADEYEPHYISDGKAYGGLQLSERDPSGTYTLGDPNDTDGYKSGGSVSVPFEMGRIQSNLNNAYGAFRKYGQTTEEDVAGTSTTWFFMTRPEMCLYQNATNEASSAKNWATPSYQCHDADILDHLWMDRDLYMYLDKHIKPYYADTNLAFIPAFTNNFKTSSLPETKFDMSKSAQTTLGVSLGIPVYNSTDSADTEITAQFNPDLRKSIIKYIDMIFKYSKSKKEGNTIPYAKIAKHNVIDISTTIFMFVVGPDGVTLESYYRSVGVVPSANPITSIPLTSAGERMDTINISFKCNTNLDSRKVSIIEHFNLLNRMGCSKIKAHSSNPDLTFEKLEGKIKTYDEAIDWYLVNRNVLDIIMDDNMKVGDWYTERFIIHADPANGRNEYKMVAIPKADRLYELLKFVLSSSPAALRFADVTGRHPKSKTHYFRNNVNALYQKYQLNADKIEELLRNADDRGGGKQNLDRKYRLNDSMTRMMNKVSRSVMNDFEASEESISIVTGERTFGDMNKNVVSAKNSAEWVMNIFREVDIDSQLDNSRMRPPITTIFSSRDDKKLEVGPGFGELKRLIEKSSKVTNGVKHDGGFTNIAFPQLAAFASVHGGFVEFLPLNQLSLNHKDYVKQIQSGNTSVFVGINRAINDKKKKWSLEAFDLDTSESSAGTLKATSEEFELYNELNPLIGKPKKNPLQVGKDAVFSESGILLLGDPVGMTAMTAYENAVEKEFTQTSIKGMNPNHHDVDDDGFIWVRDFNSSNAVSLIKNEMLYGLNILQDRKFLELLMSTNFGKNKVSAKLNGLDSNNLIRAYWMHVHEDEWKNKSKTTVDQVNGKRVTTISDDDSIKEKYFGESPADMTFELVKDVVPGSDASNYITLKPIPGRHQPFFEMRDEKLHVFRTKAVIRYVDRDDPTIIWYKTNDKVQMLTSLSDGLYPDKDTFKAYYNLDEDGTLDQAGHEVISLFDKSVMLPSMKYENVKSFLLNPSLSSNIRGVVKSTDPMKFVSFERFGETRQIHINAMDPYYQTPRVGNRQATFSQDGLSFATPDPLDLPQNQLVGDKAVLQPIKDSATAGYNVPLYSELLPDFFDGTDITGGDNGYERAYFKHFLDNGLQVNPNSPKYTKIPFVGNINWQNLAQGMWSDIKGMGVQFLLNTADDLLSTAVRKMTYNPLKFGDNTPVHVTEVELASIVDVQSVTVDDISVISEEQNNTVHVENIDLSEDKGVLSMSVEDVVDSFKEEVIIGEELTSITSFEDKLKVMETSDISLPGSEDISTLKVDEYTQEDTEDVSSVDSKEYVQEDADDVYTSVVEEYIQEDIEDVSSRIAEEYIQDDTEDVYTEMVDEHIQADIQDTYTMVAEDIVLDKKEDISLISVDEVVFDKKEDVSLVGIELVKRIMDTRRLMSVEEVKATKDPQEYILEVQEPTYTFLNLGGEETTMKVEDVPSIIDSNNIMNIEPTEITTPASKDALILGKAKKGAGILEDTLKKIDKGNIDFYAIINTIIDFDTKQVM